MSAPNSREADIARVDKALKELGVFFETVHIFCTNHNADPDNPDSGTVTTTKGQGNWHARYGQIKEWMIKQDEYTRIQCRKDNE